MFFATNKIWFFLCWWNKKMGVVTYSKKKKGRKEKIMGGGNIQRTSLQKFEISDIIMLLQTQHFQQKCIFCLFFLWNTSCFVLGNFKLFAQRMVHECRWIFETVLPILPLKLSCRFFSFRYFNLSFLLFFNWILN